MKAAYIGSFDPITVGHINIIQRAVEMYEHVYIAIGENTSKKSLFTVDERKKFIFNSLENIIDDFSKITITSFDGLAVDFMAINGITVNIRGVRNSTDVEYEENMNLINNFLNSSIDTVYIQCDPKYKMVSSSMVKMLVKSLVDVSEFVSIEIKAALEMKLLGIFLVGVVGKSGSGKSTYCKSRGFHTIDFDQLVCDIWDSNDKDCLAMRIQILSELKKIYSALVKGDTEVDKDVLREFISYKQNNENVRRVMAPFIDIQYRKALRNIIDSKKIPLILIPEDFRSIVNNIAGLHRVKFILLDAPMLIEYNGLSRVNNMIINVHVSDETSIERLKKRDGLSEKQIKNRLCNQVDADYIENKTLDAIRDSGYGCFSQVKGD